MFGSNDHNNDSTDSTAAVTPPAGSLSSFTMDPPHNDPSNPATSALPTEPTASPLTVAPSAPHVDDTSTDANDQSKPTDDSHSEPADTASPVADETPALLPPAEELSDNHEDSATTESKTSDDDLISIKQQALSQLSPLVSHLDQSPEDKFKTLMMMIQANDNQALIKDAYEAAQNITDEKAKSQALLDVVNEINYFTQDQDKDKA